MLHKTSAYTRKTLFSLGKTAKLTGRKLDHVAFPLGGIGTGSVSLGGWGQLRDWEIMNRPAKGRHLWFTFFTLKLDTGQKAPVIKVLQGPSGGDRVGSGSGAEASVIHAGGQLPHFHKNSFVGTFPLAHVAFQDERVPLDVALEAFNPFIPLNEKDSSIPVAILKYRLRNTGKRKVSGIVSGNLCNPLADPGDVFNSSKTINQMRRDKGLTGLWLSADGVDRDSPRYGSAVLATPWEKADVCPRWRYPHVLVLRDMLTQNRPFPKEGKYDIGTVGAHFELAPGESTVIPFIIAWYFPNYELFYNWLDGAPLPPEAPKPTWKNYYATVWSDAWDVAGYVARHERRLYDETKRFRDALFESTLPNYVLDAVSSQMSTLKTTTCLRLSDGTFYGFEGVTDTRGCCPGSCTHVWNYAQALPYLFPGLQRSMREADYTYAMRDDGMVQFRVPLPLGVKADPSFHPAADGQMGTVIQVYREWLISGDRAWLKRMWPMAKKALEFAWKYWDPNKDGVMEGVQHNTYDYEYYGPNPLAGILYLGALRAAGEMAKVLGETDNAKQYHSLFVRGSRWMDRRLFNGEYYEQHVNPRALDLIADSEPFKNKCLCNPQTREEFPWVVEQLKRGCLSDQLLGQWYARMLGLGSLLDERNVRKAARSIFKYNWKTDLTDHEILGACRLFAMNEERGLLICSSPKDNRPGVTQYASDEIWTGIEYAAAAVMIYEGLLEEGLSVVRAVRERYTGEYRNPWDETECGHHYARAMASWSLLPALAGFHYSAPERRMEFAPRLFEKNFAAFFSVGSGWGVYRQKAAGTRWTVTLRIDYGKLELAALRIGVRGTIERAAASCAGREIGVTRGVSKGAAELTFTEPVKIGEGESLAVTLWTRTPCSRPMLK